MKKHLFLFLAFSVLLCTKANAEEKSETTQMMLTETVEEFVDQDLAYVHLMIKEEGESKEAVQDAVNKKMGSFVKMLTQEKEIDVYTSSYTVTKRWNSILKKYDGYEASQGVHLESLDKEQILKWTAWAQEKGFSVFELTHKLSPKLIKETQDILLVKALKNAQEKAKLVAKTLHKKHYRIQKITIGALPKVEPVSQMFMAKMERTSALSEPVAQPSVEGRKVPLSLSVSIEVILWDK